MSGKQVPSAIAELVISTPEESEGVPTPDVVAHEKNKASRSRRRTPVLHLGLPLTGGYNVVLAFRKLVSAKIHHSIGWLQTDGERINSYKQQARRMRYATNQCLLSDDGPAPGLSYREWEQWLGRWEMLADLDSFFAPHLIHAYKGSKVILVERDVEAWIRDMDELLITPLFSSKGYFFARYLEPLCNSLTNWSVRELIAAYFQADTREAILKNMRTAYETHYSVIKSKVPAKRLLEYKLGSGWEPLCAFLGEPIPDEPFPNEDETATMRQLVEDLHRLRLRTVRIRLAIALMVIIAIAIGVWAYLTYT